ATWTAWQTAATITTTNATGSSALTATARCFQYRATMSTTNTAQTPVLDDVTITYQAPYDFNFSLSADPNGGKVMKGGFVTVSPGISAALTVGTAPNPVTFSKVSSTLPAGMDVTFGTPSCAITCASSFTITTTAATPLGNYAIPIKASVVIDAQNTLIKEVVYSLTVEEPFDFSLNWTGASANTTTQGGSVPADFSVIKTGGSTSEPVTFSYSTAAQGISVSFSPYASCAPSDTCPPTLTANIGTTFTGGAGDTPFGGPYTITITAATATLSKNIQFNLTVTPGFNFSMGLNPTSASLYAGDTTTFTPTLTTTYNSGSSGTVSYTVTNPDPTIITISPLTLGSHTFTTSGETFSHPPLNISVSPSFIPSAPTTFSIQFAGTSDTGLSRYATYVLTVYPSFDFTMQFSSPSTGNFNATATPQDSDSGIIYQGASLTQAISLAFNSPLPQTVDLVSAIDIAGSNISSSPAPNQCTSQYCTVMLPIISSDTTPENTYTITVTGTGGGKTHTITYALQVLIPPFDYNMRGWAWSDGIGWISFSSRNCDIDWDGVMDRVNVGSGTGDAAADAQCPVDGTIIPNYGAHLDFSSYELSGWAWSEHIGWITFEKTIAGTPPKAPYNDASQNYIALLESGTIKGWARAASCMDTNCDTDSEWGWIKMSGTATNGSPYGVGSAVSDFTGFAWGSHVMGWISFNWQNCDIDVNGTWDACGLSGPSYEYKVYALGTLPNAPPVADSLASNFLNRCTSPFAPTLSFMYKDNEGDPLMQYTINIYTSTGLLVDGPIYVPGPTVADTFLPTQYDPLPLQEIPVTYTYSGTALQYGNAYYFTVEVRDEAHLN
ncbi:hypothetical protein HY839_03245, partial [Candidatus Azambacteria bacterium]|nr:hypothetical protein [Candidatus Azambacteria bacterium]